MPVIVTPVDTAQTRLRLASAERSLGAEAAGVSALVKGLSGPLGAGFAAAVEFIFRSPGRLIVSGVGKSGLIARKIVATMASTGTPSLFVHPTEASHGDLGMITRDDIVMMLSNSGESTELSDIVAYSRRFAVPLIAMTAAPHSTLARAADVVLELPRAKEACPIGLAPTTSTLMQLALGDALAIALLEERGFTADHFRNFHPGGKLGAALKQVRDVMRAGEALPLVGPDMLMQDALVIMTEKACGCLGVIDDEGRLIGIVTDGYLRRHMSDDLLSHSVRRVMTKNPKTITDETLAAVVLDVLNELRITSIFVLGPGHKPTGLVHIHDLLRIGVG